MPLRINSAAKSRVGKVVEDPGAWFSKCLCPMCQGKVVLCGDAALMVLSM